MPRKRYLTSNNEAVIRQCICLTDSDRKLMKMVAQVSGNLSFSYLVRQLVQKEAQALGLINSNLDNGVDAYGYEINGGAR